jgi:L-ascorbate metabolism protein UlaG (beta-lactamase superfamily)
MLSAYLHQTIPRSEAVTTAGAVSQYGTSATRLTTERARVMSDPLSTPIAESVAAGPPARALLAGRSVLSDPVRGGPSPRSLLK